MQDHQPPARIDGSIHDDRLPARTRSGYVSVTGLRFGGGPFRVTDHVTRVGVAYITLAPGIDVAVCSEEQAQALIDAAGQVAAMFALQKAQVAP